MNNQETRLESKIPFVGLHAHSVAGSIFDALGYQSSIWILPTKMAWMPWHSLIMVTQTVWRIKCCMPRKWHQKAKFKPIFGCEAYFVPSIANWRKDYDKAREDAKNKKALESMQSGATVENEASKKKMKSILNRRSHMILLAMNQTCLQNIYKMISKSYTGDHFYRYPRIDYALLKKHNEGVIAASAGLGGVYAGDFWQNREEGEDAVLMQCARLRKKCNRFLEIDGMGNCSGTTCRSSTF